MTQPSIHPLAPARTLICGYCTAERQTSSCDCPASREVRAARAAQLDGRLLAQRQGIAAKDMTFTGPLTRVHFQYGATR